MRSALKLIGGSPLALDDRRSSPVYLSTRRGSAANSDSRAESGSGAVTGLGAGVIACGERHEIQPGGRACGEVRTDPEPCPAASRVIGEQTARESNRALTVPLR
jgi:hypothetical protein